jgi:tetratricopeptide (TPR) repeat protein
MRNLLTAVAIGVAIFALLFLPGILNAPESTAPAVLGIAIAYFVLARRTFKQAESLFNEAARALQSMPPKLDLAIATLEKGYALGKVQFGVKSQIDTQIGIIHFLQQDFNKAMPYLKRSLGFGHWMGGAMLAVIYYKKKDNEQMRATFDTVIKRAKGQGLAWNLYAYLLAQIGDTDAAQKVLVSALKKTKNDPKVKESLLALQNGKKIKMRGYKEQWYQFHLERPPVDQQQQYILGGRASRLARRGRWS